MGFPEQFSGSSPRGFSTAMVRMPDPGAPSTRHRTLMRSAPSANVHQYLLPVTTPLVAVEHGPCADAAVQVGAGLRLGEGRGEQVVARRGASGQFDALLEWPVRHVHHAARPGDDAGAAHPAPRQFLRHDRVLEHAQPEAAVLLRDAYAEVAHFGHLAAQFHGDVALHRVQLVGHRQHFAGHEIAGGVPDHPALFGQVVALRHRFLAPDRSIRR